MAREVLVEFVSGHKKGGQAVMKSAAVAKKRDNVKIIGFHPGGSPYKESEDNVKAERAANPVVAEVKAATAPSPEKKS